MCFQRLNRLFIKRKWHSSDVMPTGLWCKGSSTSCIFIDKCGYNIWTARSYGRARVGKPAYRQVQGQRGRNLTICLAVSPTNGLVYLTARIGEMNRQLFNDFLEVVGRGVNPDQETFLVFDNAPAHRNADCPRGIIEIKMLPPIRGS